MKKVILFLFALGVVMSSFANNLRITNIVVNQTGGTGGTVTFDIAWDNSWNITTAPANWDAVWVFVKFRDCGALSNVAFTHGAIDGTKANHTFGANLEPMTTGSGTTPSTLATASAVQGAALDYSGATGIMLRRSAITTGAVTTSQTGVVLSITNLPSNATPLTVHVDGIEMVYCLPGDFYVGDGSGGGTNFSSNGSPNRFADTSTATPGPKLITSINETVTSTYAQTYYIMTSQANPVAVTSVPVAFPKGQFGFYMMKYEITQGLYVEFLNTIAVTAAQTQHYNTTMSNTMRTTVFNNGSNFYTALRTDRAMNQMSWDDITSFLDWACLRPMTEMEYEKAARGTIAYVVNENVWGSVTITPAITFNNPVEDGTETFYSGNALYGGVAFTNGDGNGSTTLFGPARAGIFATSASNRTSAGAGYYGAMELAGNVKEWCVAMHATGTSNTFTRTWGDGTLSGGVSHNVSTWPIPGAITVANTSAQPICQRGGSVEDPLANACQTSNRIQAAMAAFSRSGPSTAGQFGGRGVR